MNIDHAPVTQFQELWPADLDRIAGPIPWLWTGYLARGSLTLLTSPWKAGKTTLTAALLARLAGGGLLAGQPVAPGNAVVVSEESQQQWAERARRFDFGSHVCFLCRPFRARPTPTDWLALLDHILGLHARHGLALAVIDPLASFLPSRTENDAGLMLEALLPLQKLTTAGLGVLLLHHPRKQPSADGQGARGSGALSGHVDLLLELQYYSTTDPADRRRKLLARSRFTQTERQLVIELNDAGTDWHNLGSIEQTEFGNGWDQLGAILLEATEKMTRTEILEAWPAAPPPPSLPTLYRWLERAVSLALAHREGTGKRNDPHRYWLQGQEEKWAAENTPEALARKANEEMRRFFDGLR